MFISGMDTLKLEGPDFFPIVRVKQGKGLPNPHTYDTLKVWGKSVLITWCILIVLTGL